MSFESAGGLPREDRDRTPASIVLAHQLVGQPVAAPGDGVSRLLLVIRQGGVRTVLEEPGDGVGDSLGGEVEGRSATRTGPVCTGAVAAFHATPSSCTSPAPPVRVVVEAPALPPAEVSRGGGHDAPRDTESDRNAFPAEGGRECSRRGRGMAEETSCGVGGGGVVSWLRGRPAAQRRRRAAWLPGTRDPLTGP